MLIINYLLQHSFELITLLAIFLGPLFAIQVQRYIDKKDELKERKQKLFSELMTTRATPIAPRHVEALNQIDVVFYEDKKVKAAWNQLLDNFRSYPQEENAPDYQSKLAIAIEKAERLLIELLAAMAEVLNYDFDKVHLKNAVYFPRGQGELDRDSQIVRSKFVELLQGKTSIPIKIVDEKEKN